jgi:hypothetical protein
MPYDAELTNAKPPGLVQSKGTFGPWVTDAPSQSPLDGEYVFDDADLGVFKGIAGKLDSTGKFRGTLGEITVDGEARVPRFRLTSGGNPVPLTTKFHAIVNGTNGDTLLEPVDAVLGKTRFSVRGGVVRYAGDRGKTINLKATFREGYVEDAMRLAVKGEPPLRGPLQLQVAIDIPPGKGEIADKLRLAGEFALPEAHFTTSTVQDKIDEMSRKAQGKPKNQSIDEVPSSMKGTFRLADGVMRFTHLEFVIPGAEVALAGEYRFAGEALDFRGTLRMHARLSQTQTGWKRWALKPIDPIFAKDGAGTVARIQVTGTRDKPEFGREK